MTDAIPWAHYDADLMAEVNRDAWAMVGHESDGDEEQDAEEARSWLVYQEEIAAGLFDQRRKGSETMVTQITTPTPAQTDAPALTLTGEEVETITRALHRMQERGSYLRYWAQLDGAESQSLSGILQDVRDLLRVFES